MRLNTITHRVGSFGNTPEALKLLLHNLTHFALDPTFEEFGNFGPFPAVGCHIREAPDGSPVYIPGDAVHPAHPFAVRFWGNFAHLSCVFQVDTDDAETIAFLVRLIAENRQTRAYKLARDAVAARGRG